MLGALGTSVYSLGIDPPEGPGSWGMYPPTRVSHQWKTAAREGTLNSLACLACAGNDQQVEPPGRAAGAERMWVSYQSVCYRGLVSQKLKLQNLRRGLSASTICWKGRKAE